MKANMEKVLRAMDVIPPFDRDCGPSEGPVNESHSGPTPSLAPLGQNPREEVRLVMFSEEDLLPTEDVSAAIPTLDLGEKILAEQRRAVARTRRAPGAAPPAPSNFDNSPLAALAEPIEVVSDEVAQLQQIVADIVARDIERLCRGWKR